MAMPATGRRSGTPQSIKLSDAPHTEAIELEPFDSRISLTMRMVYGELVVRRDQALDRALGERAVADFAAAWATHRLGFTGAEGREVVVEHEALPRLTRERVDLLLVGGRAQGGP